MKYFGFTAQFSKDLEKLQKESPKNHSKLLKLLTSITNAKSPLEGIGKPEALKGNLSGMFSRRITDKHRLIYAYIEADKINLISCYGHYSEK